MTRADTRTGGAAFQHDIGFTHQFAGYLDALQTGRIEIDAEPFARSDEYARGRDIDIAVQVRSQLNAHSDAVVVETRVAGADSRAVVNRP